VTLPVRGSPAVPLGSDEPVGWLAAGWLAAGWLALGLWVVAPGPQAVATRARPAISEANRKVFFIGSV
jgi:hypothetical protein